MAVSEPTSTLERLAQLVTCFTYSEGAGGRADEAEVEVEVEELEQLRQRLRSTQSVNFCRPAELFELLHAPGGAEWYHAVSKRLDATELTELAGGSSPMDGATLDRLLERGV
jgi:hypothetical protein